MKEHEYDAYRLLKMERNKLLEAIDKINDEIKRIEDRNVYPIYFKPFQEKPNDR